MWRFVAPPPHHATRCIMADSDIQLSLVLEVEKYPVLYDCNLPGYSRRDVTEKAWIKVSKALQLSVAQCKDKWRNARSSLLKSMKPPAVGCRRKIRKPYYLKEHMSFLLPFLKTTEDSESHKTSNIPLIKEHESSSEEEVDGNSVYLEEFDHLQDATQSSDTLEEIASSNFTTSRKRSIKTEVDTTMAPFPNKRIDVTFEPELNSETQSNMNLFFMSLLPEFDNMTRQQIRSFKIKTLQLIDDIKQDSQSATPSTSS